MFEDDIASQQGAIYLWRKIWNCLVTTNTKEVGKPPSQIAKVVNMAASVVVCMSKVTSKSGNFVQSRGYWIPQIYRYFLNDSSIIVKCFIMSHSNKNAINIELVQDNNR